MRSNIIANTFTPLYDELEDRLRVAINYQDTQNRVDLMVTRSFILNLIPTAEEFILRHYNLEPISSESIKSLDFEATNEEKRTLSKTDAVDLELFRSNEELLLEVSFSFDATTKQTAVIFTSKNATAKATLDVLILQKIFHHLKLAIPYIKWGISHHF